MSDVDREVVSAISAAPVPGQAALALGSEAAGARPEERRPLRLAEKLDTVGTFVDFLLGRGAPIFPLSVFLEVSNACDLRCAMCGPFSALSQYRKASISLEKRGFMSPDGLGKGLDDILAHALEVHCFGYGEPTLNPAFRDFLFMMSPYEVTVDFFSNGMHLSDEIIRDLVDQQVYQITISFSGATKYEYENIYIGGKYEQVLDGIRRLSDYKKERNSTYPLIVINSLGYKHHIEKLEAFMELMGSHGVNQVQLGPVFSTFPELETHIGIMRPWIDGPIIERARAIGQAFGTTLYSGNFEATRVTTEQEYDERIGEQRRRVNEAAPGRDHIPIEKLKEAGKLTTQFDPGLAGITPDIFKEHHLRPGFLSLSADELAALYDFRPSSELSGGEIHCYEPFKTFYVTRNWNVKPCCNAVAVAPSAPLGSLNENSGTEIWRSRPFQMVRAGMRDSNYPNMCHGCVKNGTAYPDHFFLNIIDRYALWYRSQYGVPFPVDFAMLKGHDPLSYWQEKGKDLLFP